MKLARKPKWVTFDCYGTLIDTRVGYTEVWRRILSDKPADPAMKITDYVQAWGEEEFRLVKGPYLKYRDILVQSVEATLKRFGLPVAPEDGLKLADAWGTFQPYADVKPALNAMKKHCKLAIISNADNEILRQSVASIGVEFDAVFSAEDCGAYKPSRIPFEYALKNMGVPAGEVLHAAFGYQYDHFTASEMGFMTVWINRRQLNLPEGAKKFDLEIPDVSSLPALIE